MLVKYFYFGPFLRRMVGSKIVNYSVPVFAYDRGLRKKQITETSQRITKIYKIIKNNGDVEKISLPIQNDEKKIV